MTDFRDLFNITTRTKAAAPPPAQGGGPNAKIQDVPAGGTEPSQREGAFVTPQSIVSFPVASGVVTLIWKTMAAVFPIGDSKLVPLVISLAVGALLYFIHGSDPAAAPADARKRAISIAIAIINSLVLFSAAVGIGTLAANGAAPPPPAQEVVNQQG